MIDYYYNQTKSEFYNLSRSIIRKESATFKMYINSLI